VLSIYDARTRATAEVRPSRGRELRLHVSAPPADGAIGLADLRRYLTADLVRRTAQRHRLAVSLDHDGESRALTALNIYPPEQVTLATSGADLCVVDGGTEPADDSARQSARQVVLGRTTAGAADLVDPLAALAERGLDPLALRLVFLEHHYRQPLEVTWAELTEAGAALHDWRRQVAVWATQPSKPVCAQYMAELTGAFDDDLDSPAALRALRTLAADAEIPPGSKFETAAHVDQLLGLDLVSEVGRAL
jgi:cysteinyl-tRNA synthetase